ncbi:MAG: hypothetical protein DWQ44_11610 [Bacteroidetes bacterium]|nr:MAG: hypothetical protein DWQ33_09730 [Bacteroidota bacterium]REK05267.1 MAG: hypothetical protein DWQ39_08740 [Bacteroidota bacterium]REK32672.1 MAG: hypothetical protein DWQ44_11610 [Bacteroidota bacterium]REK48881.1 MAG: hypothetical protein DWQ48_08350 [Bacteroidota bacterium]
MKKPLPILFMSLIFIMHVTHAQEFIPASQLPEIPLSASDLESFIPVGWELIKTVSGDLDLLPGQETAMVIQKKHVNNPELEAEAAESPTQSERDRILIILTSSESGNFFRVSQSEHIIFSDSGWSSSTDPFHSLEIKDNNLIVNFKGKTVKASWEIRYSFKFITDAFYLAHAFSTGKSEIESFSYEYYPFSGELNYEFSETDSSTKKHKDKKQHRLAEIPRLDNFVPLSLVIDENEGIIF